MKKDYKKIISDLMFSVWDYGWHCGHIDDHEDEEIRADGRVLKLEDLLFSEVEHDLVALLCAIGEKPEDYDLRFKSCNLCDLSEDYSAPYLEDKDHD